MTGIPTVRPWFVSAGFHRPHDPFLSPNARPKIQFPSRGHRAYGMKLLLDSHAFLWFCEGSPSLSRFAREQIELPANE
jgi:hypothetical protein